MMMIGGDFGGNFQKQRESVSWDAIIAATENGERLQRQRQQQRTNPDKQPKEKANPLPIKVLREEAAVKKNERIIVPKLKEIDIIKTKMCRNMMTFNKCHHNNCKFAHTIGELRPQTCAFGKRCRFRTSSCGFVHNDESMDEYIKRCGLERFIRRINK